MPRTRLGGRPGMRAFSMWAPLPGRSPSPPKSPSSCWGTVKTGHQGAVARALRLQAGALTKRPNALGQPRIPARNRLYEVSTPRLGSQCSPPLRRWGPGPQQTPARLRLDRSVLPRPGLGQWLPAWDGPPPPAGKPRYRRRAQAGSTQRPGAA